MLKVECRYRAKLEIIDNLLDLLENNDLTQDEIIAKLKKSWLFYRSQLARLD